MKAKVLAEFRAMQLAVLGSASNKNASVLSLEGVDTIELGDNIEIKEVSLTMDYVVAYMGDISSFVHISALSDDIIEEIKKPLRDIRDNYPTPVLKSDVLHIEDLVIGMELEGTVRSVVDFGAFVDIGLKNDGLVHKSKLSKNKINHPLDIVSVGDIIKVYVCDVDLDKNRVGLSLFKD